MVNTRKNIVVEGRDTVNTWARAINLLSQQTEILAGEEFGGNANVTKDACLLLTFDEEAVEEIVSGKVHPRFATKTKAKEKYNEEFTYRFVKMGWNKEDKYKFVYDYMDRLINSPVPKFIYMGNYFTPCIPDKYLTKNLFNTLTGGMDQLLVAHDRIRDEGISRRIELTTWIPAIDDFSTAPPCLQIVWLRVLVPKSEWYKYPGCIPVEACIMYRSWDIPGALPSNLYGLTNMLYRYVLGNLTEEDEYLRDKDGEYKLDENFEPILNPERGEEFKIVSLKCFTPAGHGYNDSYDLMETVKQVFE